MTSVCCQIMCVHNISEPQPLTLSLQGVTAKVVVVANVVVQTCTCILWNSQLLALAASCGNWEKHIHGVGRGTVRPVWSASIPIKLAWPINVSLDDKLHSFLRRVFLFCDAAKLLVLIGVIFVGADAFVIVVARSCLLSNINSNSTPDESSGVASQRGCGDDDEVSKEEAGKVSTITTFIWSLLANSMMVCTTYKNEEQL